MEKLPKIVVKRLRQRTVAESHPDADLLTAFSEQLLTGREREGVVEHLARCGDCREVVAFALPAMEEAAAARPVRVARAGWLSWPVLRWGVVAAGLVVVASVGVLQFRQRHEERALVATNVAPKEAAREAVAEPSPAAPSENATGSTKAPAETRKQTAAAEKKQAAAQDELAADRPASAATMPEARAVPGTTHGTMPRSGSTGAGSGYAGGSFRGGGRLAAAPRNSSAGEARSRSSAAAEPESVGKAKAASTQAAAPMAPAPWLRTEPSLMKGAAAPRWTIGADGALQRSVDGGKSWQDVSIAADEPASAKATRSNETVEVSGMAAPVQKDAEANSATPAKAQAPGKTNFAMRSVAKAAPAVNTVFRALSVSADAMELWAGGSGGALYHTVDGGNRWVRVTPSDDSASLSGDVIGIQFADATNLVVRTSTAEGWITADGGKSWKKQ